MSNSSTSPASEKNLRYEKIPLLAKKKPVAVVGCSGMAGQQFVEALDGHPWFEIVDLFANSTAGKTYYQARRSISGYNPSPEVGNIVVKKVEEGNFSDYAVVFSAIPSEQAEKIEANIAKVCPVISTASFYRYHDDIPIYLPIVNGEHYPLFDLQKKNRGWKGFIAPGPNCTTVGLVIALAPIYEKFGIKTVHMASMQAVSGAGYNGVSSYDILGNVIPYIPGEEGKVPKEVIKILGKVEGEKINTPKIPIEAKCNRVAVLDGHTESVFIQTENSATIEEIEQCFREYKGQTAELGLPNEPTPPIQVYGKDQKFLPQPRVNLERADSGMTTFIGGIENTVFENGFKFTVLSHNTELGAGRGGVLSAEYLVKKNYI